MLRESIFRSGLPTLVATVCCLVFAYVAIVRRERLATLWAIAWALLIARYTLYVLWPGVLPEYAAVLAGALRVGFAGAVYTGVSALRGERVLWRDLLILAIGVPAVGHSMSATMNSTAFAGWVELVAMDLLLASAAWRLARGTTLQEFERHATSLALAVYAVCSTIAPRAASGSTIFTIAIMGTWATQLLVGFGLLATFFRLSHDAELRARAVTERGLTVALGEFVSVCMHCKSVRDEASQWQPLEHFVSRRSASRLSHGLCPTCETQFYPDGALTQ
jgi:hypothetical protein